MRTPDWDVVVVGAGPSGAAAAIGCAQAGLRTAILERSPFPRHRPGEMLPPGVEPLLGTLGVDERVLIRGFVRHAGISVAWGGPPRFEPFGSDVDGPWRAFEAPRAELDSLLLTRCCETGVTLFQPRRALGVEVDGRRVAAVVTDAGTLRSRFVIDAAGGGHWLARQLKRKPEAWSQRLVVRYGYAEGDCPERDGTPSLTADQEGWTWIARIRAGQVAWTRLDLAPGKRTSARWRPEPLAGLRPLGSSRGADVTWRMVHHAAGPGYFMVGDAAAVLDPASSHGVLKGLMGGILAARRIEQVVNEGVPEAEAAEDYNRRLRALFVHDVERLDALYRRFPGWESLTP
jgi:flavin-dependent dehydrogenase